MLENDFAEALAKTNPVIYLQFDTLDTTVSVKISGRNLVFVHDIIYNLQPAVTKTEWI